MSTIRVNTLQDSAGVERYTARAWVNFNGTGTVAIRASGNVSSITDSGTGDYTVNFTTAMVDANYCLQANANRSAAAEPTVFGNSSTAQTAAGVSLRNTNNAGAPIDGLFCHIVVFR